MEDKKIVEIKKRKKQEEPDDLAENIKILAETMDSDVVGWAVGSFWLKINGKPQAFHFETSFKPITIN